MFIDAQMAQQQIHDSSELNITLAEYDVPIDELYSLPMFQQPMPGHVEISNSFYGPLFAEKKLKLRPHFSSVEPWILSYSVGNPVIAGCCEYLADEYRWSDCDRADIDVLRGYLLARGDGSVG